MCSSDLSWKDRIPNLKYSSVWYSVLPRDATDVSEAFKMDLVRFFFSHDGGTRSKKSMISTAVLCTPIFELRLIP